MCHEQRAGAIDGKSLNARCCSVIARLYESYESVDHELEYRMPLPRCNFADSIQTTAVPRVGPRCSSKRSSPGVWAVAVLSPLFC